MKTRFLFHSAFQFLSTKTWDPFPSVGETPRSVVMTPEKTMIAGSNKGRLAFYNINQEKTWIKKIDDFPVYSLQASKYFTIARTTSDRLFLLDHSGNLLESKTWDNLTMFECATPFGMYARLSSDFWLSCWKDGKWSSHLLPSPKGTFVSCGYNFGNLFFFLTLDWNLLVHVWKEDAIKDYFTIPLQPMKLDVPTFMDVVRTNEHPLHFKILVGGTQSVSTYDIDLIGRRIISGPVLIDEEGSTKGIILQKEFYLLQQPGKIRLKHRFVVNDFPVHTEMSSQFQFVHPALITNTHKQVLLMKLTQE